MDHHANSVRYCECLFAVVGDKNGCGPLGAQDRLHFLPQRLAHGGVQVAKRLIEQDRYWVRRQGTGKRNPLLLAS